MTWPVPHFISLKGKCGAMLLVSKSGSTNATRIKFWTNLFLPFPPFLLLFPAALNSSSIERWRHSNLVQMKKVPFSRFSLIRSNDSDYRFWRWKSDYRNESSIFLFLSISNKSIVRKRWLILSLTHQMTHQM